MVERDSTPEAGSTNEHPADDVPVLRSTRLPATATAALRSSLADQEARTHELREALDELRATLEATPAGGAAPAPARPRPPRRPRRAIALVVAAALLATAAGTVFVLQRRPAAQGVAAPVPSSPAPSPVVTAAAPVNSGSGAPGASASALVSATPTAPPAASPSASPPSVPALTTHPLAWPGGAVLLPRGLPASGPGADAPGLEMTAALDPDKRHIDVIERAVLRPGVTSLHLAQAGLGSLPRVLRGARPAVQDLQVELDGQAVRAVAGSPCWRSTAPGAGAIEHAVLRYRLLGAIVRQAPAPPGRATLLLTPLAAAAVAAGHDPAVVRINDRRVGTVYCPVAAHPLCAVTTGRTHVARVPLGTRAVVLAQVNLR